ncbi:hypothetical protein [Streptomyces sp. NBC_00316]|uniref:hypothetical protein n=1 Tax=Streptomyces sp. NBC_00316 TaxID=2975710 RepID=UPI002E2928EE|nr:hypothetical protein [Streptomyces sp. NBC_00316]
MRGTICVTAHADRRTSPVASSRSTQHSPSMSSPTEVATQLRPLTGLGPPSHHTVEDG